MKNLYIALTVIAKAWDDYDWCDDQRAAHIPSGDIFTCEEIRDAALGRCEFITRNIVQNALQVSLGFLRNTAN